MGYKNKEDQALAAKRHYENNKEKVKARAVLGKKEYRERNRNYIKQYLQTHSCVDCGENDPIVLEFDHVRGSKLGEISNMKQRGWSIDNIQLEIDKCEVRCANCHRRVTYYRRQEIISSELEKSGISVGS